MFKKPDIHSELLPAVFVATSGITTAPVVHENGSRIRLNSEVLQKLPSIKK
jgi:hypothetical protein